MDILYFYHKTIDALLKAENYNDGLTVCNYLEDLNDSIHTEIENEDGDTLTVQSDIITKMLKIEIFRQLGQQDDAVSLIKR